MEWNPHGPNRNGHGSSWTMDVAQPGPGTGPNLTKDRPDLDQEHRSTWTKDGDQPGPGMGSNLDQGWGSTCIMMGINLDLSLIHI